MNFYSVIVEVVSIVFSISGFISLVIINSILIKANRLNPDYNIKSTIKVFRYLFLTLALLDSLIVYDIFYNIGRLWITVFFVIKGFATILTVLIYYMELPKFNQRKTLKEHIKTIDNVITEFKNSTLSPALKKELLLRLENYKENER